ncbi:MAG: hypothetical protein ACRD3G_09460 [Vicinamibacterales bacterium]
MSGRLTAAVVLGGCALLLASVLYLLVLIFELNPGLVGADGLAVTVLGVIALLAAAGMVIAITRLR